MKIRLQKTRTEQVKGKNDEQVNVLPHSPSAFRRFISLCHSRLISAGILVIIIMISCSAFILSEYVLINTVNGTSTFMTSDNLGNLYMVVNNELRKYDTDGKLQKTYSDKSLGNLDFVDVTNPLTILLHYKDLRQLVFLDNMLSVKGSPIVLDNLGVLQPTLVCNSYDDGFWIYDQQEFQLERFNKDLSISNQSGNIVQLTGLSLIHI